MGAGGGQAVGGSVDGPEVLADLDAEAEGADIEEKVGADRHAVDLGVGREGRAGDEVAFFVELAVGGEVGLGDVTDD